MGRAPVACAIPRRSVVLVHRDDRTRTMDERSQAAVSVSSAGSIQADLIRARDIARKRRERLETEEEETPSTGGGTISVPDGGVTYTVPGGVY